MITRVNKSLNRRSSRRSSRRFNKRDSNKSNKLYKFVFTWYGLKFDNSFLNFKKGLFTYEKGKTPIKVEIKPTDEKNSSYIIEGMATKQIIFKIKKNLQENFYSEYCNCCGRKKN